MGGQKTIKHAIQNWMHLKCQLFKEHEYLIENKYTEDILKLGCKKCRKKFGVNLKSALIFAWDEDMMLLLSIYEKNLVADASLKHSPNIKTPLKAVI